MSGAQKLVAEGLRAEEKSWLETIRGKLGLEEIEINATFVKAKFKEPEPRKTIRELIGADAAKTLSLIRSLAAFIRVQEEGRGPLILIDDLDKPELRFQEAIFFDNFTSLLGPDCVVVYTFNNSLRYDKRFTRMTGQIAYLPNINLWLGLEATDPDTVGREYLKRVVWKRMDRDLIAAAALELLVDLSGGVLDQLRDLMAEAISAALLDGAARIAKRHIDEAASTYRKDNFETALSKADRILLKQIHADHQLESADIFRDLLFSRAVLEYRNGNYWWEVNPIVLPLLPLSI